MIRRILTLVSTVLALLLSSLAVAQVVRPLPADLVVTTMTANGSAVVVLGERQVQLSPAAQVRGQDNLIIQPASLYGKHRVGFKQDLQGMVHRIWLLTDDEYTALTSK
ncbi:hypothetical protein [Nitrogeniibacter aestuarii]|uniref:hypothetical protein n=1 Tax=Nitrogeniibacter aestuarii TaxID=2815343 RepID=UPI001D11A5C6|nr:hypothetical protein [Nitrogeniibacter aestuarii]